VDLYPIIFKPVTIRRPWGGSRLRDVYGIEHADDAVPVARSLELVDNGETQSRVTNGEFQGATLRELVERDATAVVGNRFRGRIFPLRCSFIDSSRRLALEVHPDDNASTPSHPSRTKLWYVLDADDNAEITVGLKNSCTRQQFFSRLETGGVEEMVQSFPAVPNDAYYIPAGRAHSIGGSSLIFCVEQAQGASFLLSDWGDPDCRFSENTLEATGFIRTMRFQDRTLARIRGESNIAPRNRKVPIVGNCPHFHVSEWRVAAEVHERTMGKSFHMLTALDGEVEISSAHGAVRLTPGTCCFVPAAVSYYNMVPIDGFTRVLKTSLQE
jgi:mannose-6-phosphate isomerase